jgi:uncharacterized protein (DUF1778 family)
MSTRIDRIEARVAPERAERIREAAELAHQSVSSFVIDAAEEKAERIILEQRETDVPSSFFDELLAALDEPPTAVPALHDAAERAGKFVTPR